MKRLERTRLVLNRLSEPLRKEQPEPTDLEVERAERDAEWDGERPLACIDADDPANT